MRKFKKVFAGSLSALLLVSAVPVFAVELTDKIYVSNAINNTLKAMNTEQSSEVYEKIAKGAFTQNFDMIIKDYTLPAEWVEDNIFNGYSLSNSLSMDPTTYKMFNKTSFKNPNGDALSLNYIFTDSGVLVSVPEIMENYVEIGAMGQELADAAEANAAELNANVFDMQAINSKVIEVLEVLTDEIEVKVIGANKADATLTEAKITLKAESLNKFVKEYMSLYQLTEMVEDTDLLKNDITIDLLINKENIVTGFSTIIKEAVEQETYEYDDVTYETKTKTITTNATVSIDGTYKNDKLEMNITALEDENKLFEVKITNQDVRDAKSKITSSKTNIVALGGGTTVTMAIDTLIKEDGYTDVALVSEIVNAVAKTEEFIVGTTTETTTKTTTEDNKHTFTLNTSYKTVVGEKEVKVEMPNLDIKVDDMVFNLSSNYSLASSEFVLPEYTSVKMDDITEEETTEITNKAMIQAIKVLPATFVDQLMGN